MFSPSEAPEAIVNCSSIFMEVRPQLLEVCGSFQIDKMIFQKALDEVRDGDVIVLANKPVNLIRKGHFTVSRKSRL